MSLRNRYAALRDRAAAPTRALGRRAMSLPLRNRFTALFVGFAVLVTTLVGTLAWRTAGRELEGALDQRLLDIAGVAAEFGSIQDDEELLLFVEGDENLREWRDYRDELQRLAREYVDRADVFRWQPGESRATAIVATGPNPVGIGQELSWVQPHISWVRDAYADESATTELFEAVDEDGVRRPYKFGIWRLPEREGHVDAPGNELARAFLGVRIRADFPEPLNRLRWTIVALSAGAALLAAILGWGLARGIVARLGRLSVAALRIQRGWLDRPVELDGEDELSRLARAMERMRSGILRRDEQLRLMPSLVAHEIRNPLGGLELFAAAAMEEEDPAERRRVLARVRREVVSLNGIITEFLAFARPRETKPTLHDVREPLREAAELAEAELASRGGALHLDLPEGPLPCLADPEQVKRLTLNLLRNAAQAGTRVWASAELDRGEVRIAVRDNGPGVPDGLRERIFEPYIGDKEQGAGLGLAIVKQLVEANGGRVELLPPGGGAEFHVYLGGPEDLPPQRPQEGEPPEERSQG